MEKTWRNFIICIIGGILFNYLFYGKGLGISYPIYAIYLYLVFFVRVSSQGKKQSLFDLFLFVSALLLATSFSLFSNVLLLFLNFLIVPILMFIHMIHARRWEMEKWSNRLFVKSMFITFSDTFQRFFKLFQFAGRIGKRFMHDKNYQIAKKIIIGFVLSIPLLWTIIYLLISSDEHFKHVLGKFPIWLYQANIGSILFQMFVVAFISIWLFAYFITLTKPLVMSEEIHEVQSVKMDIVIVSTILLLVNVVYFLYTAVQFTYFFTGNPSNASLGYTYAEYARRGFTELTIVSLINLGLLFLLTPVSNFQKATLPRIVKLLLSIMVIFTFVMLSSAYYRLSLYEQAYGYTYSRVYAHALMILLFVLLVLAMFKVIKEKFKLLRAMFIVTLLAYVIVNYLNIDRFIISQNMNRFEETGKIDVNYLGALSYESIPVLIEQDNEKFNELLKEKAVELNQGTTDWQSFNFSISRAKHLLDGWKPIEK
ncbi:MAG: DUF4153 domain-containing protein [Bacillota bacterium]